MGAQRRPMVERKLTGVSRNSGWGFGAVELYCWWYTEWSWTWTHQYTNALTHIHTHTHHTEHQGARQGREFKREKVKRKRGEAEHNMNGWRWQTKENPVSKRKCTRKIIAECWWFQRNLGQDETSQTTRSTDTQYLLYISLLCCNYTRQITAKCILMTS